MAHICYFLESIASAAPQKLLTICEERRRSASQVVQRVAALSAALVHAHGLQPGERVALAAHNTDNFLEALLAITAAGAIAAPLNWRWSADEAAAAMHLCGCRLLLFDAACTGYCSLAGSAGCPSLRHSLLLGNANGADGGPRVHNCEDGIAAHWGSSLTVAHNRDGAAVICFTSGTTGRPKGVLVSHVAFHCQAAAKLLVVGYCAADMYLHAAPLFHIGGLSSALAVLLAGSTHVFAPRFSAAAAVCLIRQHSVTAFIAVPAMVADLAAAAAHQQQQQGNTGVIMRNGNPLQHSTGAAALASSVQLPSVERLLVGAGGMPPELQRQLAELFPHATVHTAYGMTEACSSMTFLLLAARNPATVQSANSSTGDARSAASLSSNSQVEVRPAGEGVCVGAPPPGIQMAVLPAGIDARTPDAVQACGTGEVLTRGPHTLLRYWAQPQETQAAYLAGNWLRTGDVGRVDAQGRVWLQGRARDTVRSGSETVHAAEVEAALQQHPAVQQVAVVGMPHPRLGEQVTAVLRLQEGWAWQDSWQGSWPDQQQPSTAGIALVALQQLQQHCRTLGLSAYKLPRAAYVSAAPLPVNASGKLLKHVLKQQLSRLPSARL